MNNKIKLKKGDEVIILAGKDKGKIGKIIKVKPINNTNLVKIVSNRKNEVLYISRANLPYEFRQKVSYLKKHLSIVSFKPEALLKFGNSKRAETEKAEDIELLRALDVGLKIKTLNLKGDSFSVDVFEDYTKAQDRISRDRYLKFYR